MISGATQLPARRIAVALEVSAAGRPLVEACARLAARLGAELEGIFVEDVNLLRLSGLSFLRELRPSSLGEEAVSARRMQSELRALARAAEQMLEQAARETGVPWSFRVWRGQAGAEALAGGLAAEFLGLARIGRRASLRLWAASGFRAYRPPQISSGICVLLNAGDTAQQLLETAAYLAQQPDNLLTVLLPAAATEQADALREAAAMLLAGHGQTARFIRLERTDAASLAQAALRAGAAMLVAETGHPLFRSAGLETCMEALSCAVLLVR